MYKESVKYLGFDDKWFVLLGIPLLSLFIPFAFFESTIIENNGIFNVWLETLLHSATYWIGVRLFMIFIRKKFQGFQFTRKRVILEVLFILVYGFTAAIILNEIATFFKGSSAQEELSLLDGYIATYFSSFFVLSIYEAVYLYAQNERTIIETEKLKREQMHSELQGLRNQVNPHFLFNSLNTLMNIIDEDQNLASSFVKKLSNVYRYILENRKENLIPLQEEIDFIEAYVFLLKERFKNNLTVSIDISDQYLKQYVLPLSLQILFENAIKHNIIASKKPLHINAYIDPENKLTIENNYQPKNQVMDSTGVGLENISSRLTFFTEKKLSTEIVDGKFIVKIPLVHDYIKS